MLRKVVFVLIASLLLVNQSVWMSGDVHAKDEAMHLPSLQDAQEIISQSRGFFTENKGQWDPEILFVGNTDFGKVAFTRDAIYYQLIKVEESEHDLLHQSFPAFSYQMVELSFVDAGSAEIEGLELLPHYHNYFIGNDSSKWATECRNFAQVSYTDIWEGIDLSYFFSPEGLKYEYYVHPHAQMEDLKVMVEGAELQENNNYLSMITPIGSLQDDQLLVYRQDTGLTIPASFTVEDNFFSFQGIPEDRTETVVIDPLVYSTFLGGGSWEYPHSIALDSSGNAYIAGSTGSSDFPMSITVGGSPAPGYDQSYNEKGDAFVVKLSADGTQLLYATYLGGSASDPASVIALDSSGNAYIAGSTGSSDFPMSTTVGGSPAPGYDQSFNEKGDAFVVKLSADGTQLLYATYLGGSNSDYANSIAVDSSGNAYIAGNTSSFDFPMSTTVGGPPAPGYDQSYYERGDAFVVKLSADGTQLLYATYLGGSRQDSTKSIALDSSGNVYIIGITDSSDFPMSTTVGGPPAPGYDQSYKKGNYDAFVVKLNADGTQLLYATYLGGSNLDDARSIALDSSGNAYIAGVTDSSDFPMSTTVGGPPAPGYDQSKNEEGDAFVVKLNADGTQLLYATYLGGTGLDSAYSIAVDSSGNAYIAGNTSSFDFPMSTTVGGPSAPGYDQSFNEEGDAFLVKLNADGTQLLYATYLGGSSFDYNYSIAVDSLGNAYIVGNTFSSDFPMSTTVGGPPAPGYNQRIKKGNMDAFVVKLSIDESSAPPDPPKEDDYPILLVHGFQFYGSYNPLEVWEFMIRGLSGQDLRFLDKKEAYSSENKEFRKKIVQIIPIDASEGHYVFKIPALTLNGSLRTVYIADYSHLLLDKNDPVNSKRDITISDFRVYAKNLKSAVNVVKLDNDSDKVNIIAHSMGGLVARTYIEEQDFNSAYAKLVYPDEHDGPRKNLPSYDNDVYRLIMLGTPNHGTQISKTSFLLPGDLRADHGPDFENHFCVGQMETNSKFLKILNYEKDQDWNINNEDILHPDVHYHSIGGIIPSNSCGLLLVPNLAEKCFMAKHNEVSQKLTKNENSENLLGYDDGLVPANSVRIYHNNKLLKQSNNLNHIILYVDHSQLIRIHESVSIINQLLSNSNKKIKTEQYFRDQILDDLYTMLSAVVFSPAILQMHSGNEALGFDIPNATQNAYVDYFNGSIQWYNPPNENVAYRLEGFEDGTYGVRFTSVDFKGTQSAPLVFEAHGFPTSKGRVDQIHINWNTADVKMESDIDGDGSIDQVITAPGAPSSLSATFEQSFARLTWQASRSGSSSLRGYSIFRRVIQEEEFVSIGFVEAGNSLVFIDSGIVKDKSYVYYIQAVDAQNMSSISSNFALLDREGPEIEITHPTPDMNLTSSSIEVMGFARDMSGVRAVWVNNVEAYYDSNNQSFVSHPIMVDQAPFTITVKAEDLAGNQSIKSLQVLKRFPTVIKMAIGSTFAEVIKDGKMEMVRLDLAPFIQSGRTFVPLRFIAEAFGAKVDWIKDPLGNSKGRIEITFTRADASMVIMKMRDLEQVVIIEEYAAGSVTSTTSSYTMDVAPFIVQSQNRTVVPIRFIAEGFGAWVNWDPQSREITIIMDEAGGS